MLWCPMHHIRHKIYYATLSNGSINTGVLAEGQLNVVVIAFCGSWSAIMPCRDFPYAFIPPVFPESGILFRKFSKVWNQLRRIIQLFLNIGKRLSTFFQTLEKMAEKFPTFGKALFGNVHRSSRRPSKNHPCDSQGVNFSEFPRVGTADGSMMSFGETSPVKRPADKECRAENPLAIYTSEIASV